MICLTLSVILLSFLQKTWKWCSRYPSQAVFSSPFLLPGQGNETYQSGKTSVHISLLGAVTMEANAPTLRADINQLERVQRLATWLVRGFRQVPYNERLRQLNLISLERRRLRADFILAFKIFKGEVDLSPSDLFLRPLRGGLRGHIHRLLQAPSRLRHRSCAFSVRVVKYWNRLPAPLVLSPSVSVFKKKLDRP